MKAPIVQQHMTRLPLEIERVDNVANARRMMELFEIRHVPVMNGLHVEGVVSERDILRATAQHGQRNVDSLPIEEISQQNVLTVGPLTPVDQVARKMLEHGAGSALVVDGEYLVGIFTSTDALRMLANLFGRTTNKA